ncbi:MAG: response regulator [Selenomonadaceae bacterium]
MEQKFRVLITDDSSLLRRKLRGDLEQLGCEVSEAKNGKEAIMEALTAPLDVIILDIVMPEVDGVEALRAIRQARPDLPVLMLSSAGSSKHIIESLQLGAIDFIQKPYGTEQLKQALSRIRKRGSENA